MEGLVKEMSQKALPSKRIEELLKLHLNKHKGKNLPWIDITRLLSRRVVESECGFLFRNMRKLCKIKLSETVNKGLKLSKKSCQKYRDMLCRLQTEVHYNLEETDVPLADINQLSSHFLAAIIDLNTPAIMRGCEAEAVSRIYIKITLMMGSSPDLILDTLLQCKTLIYSSIRNPLMFIPLIKRIFHTFKVQTSLTPKLYLKFLLLGKLWLFMEEKSKLPNTRMYIIKSLPVPQSFKEWACQNNLNWLKENDFTTKTILKRMTVSATLNILHGKCFVKQQDLTSDTTNKEMNSKNKNTLVQEKETITSEHSEIKAETTGNNDEKKKKTKKKKKKKKKNQNKKIDAGKGNDDSISMKETEEMTKMDEIKEQENVKPGKSVLKQREREGDDELPENIKKLKVQSVQKPVEKREETSKEEMYDSFSEKKLKNQKRKNVEETTPVLVKVKKVASKSEEKLKENDIEVLDKNKKTKRKLETVVDDTKERIDSKEKNDAMLKRASEKIRTDKYIKAVQKLADTHHKGKEVGLSDATRSAESQIHKGRVNIVKKNQQVVSRSEELNSMGDEEIEDAVHKLVERKEVKTPEAKKKLCLFNEVATDGKNKKLKTSPVITRLQDLSQERKQLGSSPSVGGNEERVMTSPWEKVTMTREDIIEVRQRIRRNSVSFTVTDLMPKEDMTPNKEKSPYQRTANKICSRIVQSPSGMTFEVFDMDDDDDHQSVDSDDASSVRSSTEEPGEKSNLNEKVEENDTSDIIEVSETDSVVAVTQTPNKDHAVNDKTKEIGNTSTGKELDSELEIVEVIQKKEPEVSQKDENTLEDSSDIDEASASDSDIIPCDESTKMFTDEENKHYHDKLIAQELKRKAENIVEMDKLEFQRKKTKENGHHVSNGDDAGNPDTDERKCEVVNVNCTPNSHTEEKRGSEHGLESDGDMEILLQTIARDTGRIASVSGYKENLVPKENIQDRLEEIDIKECTAKEKEADLASENKKLSNGPVSTSESTDGNHANHVKDLDRKVNGIDSRAIIENKKDEDTNHIHENEVPSEDYNKESDINSENIKNKNLGDNIEVENKSAANNSFRSESPDVEPLRIDNEFPENPDISPDNKNSQSAPPLKDSIPVDSVEEDSESTEGADEAYEASSDASEDPMPKVRKRTRSLRRNLISHSVLQDASDSDVSPIRNRRSRMTSEVTPTAGKESPHRQRTRSACSEVTRPHPDALETDQLVAPNDMGNDIDVKSLSEVVCDVHQNISECDSLCSLETMQDSTGTHITSEDTSFFLNDLKGSHSISSSATPIISASGTPIKNATDPVSSPVTRRSSRLLASEISEKSKTQRRSLPSGALSDAAVTSKSLATRVLTRNVRRKSFSDTEMHSQQAHQQKFDVMGSPKITKKVENNSTEIMKITEEEVDSDNLSLGLDGNFSSSSLSCSLLQIEEEPLAECDNNNEKQIQAAVSDLRIYDTNADATSESQIQEKEQKLVLANQVSASAEDMQEGTDATESDIVCHVSDSENQVKLRETESMEVVICDQLSKGSVLEDHHEVEACLPEDVDEELEVLSTSGVDDTEDLSYGLPSSFTLNKEEGSENLETQITTPKSFTRLRSLSQRRSGGKGSKKDDRVNDLKFDSPHLSSPKVKAQLVSEAVLNKEVLISPEVSDEECELVSPGGDEANLPKDSFTLSGGPDTVTPVSRRNKRRSGGGIRSPQKMIPEEQDETTTHIASVPGSPASKISRIQRTKIFSPKSPKVAAENTEESTDITVSEQQKSVNTETEVKVKSSMKSASQELSEEIISNKSPVLETPAATPSPRRNSGKGHATGSSSQAAPDIDAESDTSVVKESSEVASVSTQETSLNLDSESKYSPVKTRRNRRSSLAIMASELKPTDIVKINKIKYSSPDLQNENAETSKEDSAPVYRTRRSMTLKKQDLKQELLSAPFSPRRSSRRKSVASNSSESTGSIEVMPLRSRRSSTASSSEDKHPQIPEEPACPKKSSLKNTPMGLASPRTKNDRTSLLKNEPRNSSPARATRSSSSFTEVTTNLASKSGTPVRTSSRLASRKESHTDSSCENGSSSETSSKGSNIGRSFLKKVSSDVPSTSSDTPAGQLNVSAKVNSELHTASVTDIKSPTKSSTFKPSHDKKVASSSSGNESPARPFSPVGSKTPVRSASLPLVNKTPTRSSPLNSVNKTPSGSPMNKRSLRSPSVNKTPVRSPITNASARSPGRPPSVNKSLTRSPAASTVSLKSATHIKSPLTSPIVNRTLVTASASEASLTSPTRVSRRSLSSDRSPLASPSSSKTHTRSSSISKSPGRLPTEKGATKQSPRKSSSPSRAADTNSKGSSKDAEPVMTTRSLRHRQVTYSVS
nr:mucin-17-like [Penaeus vannamei]